MAGQVVQMDYQVIGNVSKGFSDASQALTAVGKVLDAAVQVLRAAAFLSFGTTLALAQYLENIETQVNKLATDCEEKFAKPLSAAIGDHRRGDVQGKNYFGRGINLG
jgi:hypothetical protein